MFSNNDFLMNSSVLNLNWAVEPWFYAVCGPKKKSSVEFWQVQGGELSGVKRLQTFIK